ncbi:monooxygenase [Legionella sp. PC1000]|uniref:FAD-dependent monooxygenase n=1 Tax=Legionella sp. PC1000 TaxID=2746060 RepID=UPI0015FE750F|nr:FAD-dependent monooxygenase [Legionella sp. PC1000]QLZ68529.1 monooxygenase [Legionella sp. PC1000]
MPSKNVDILIIGAGMGGLTCAIACKQAGFLTTVLERNSEPGAIGAGIWLPPNALQVYEQIEILKDLFPLGYCINQINLISAFSGKLRETNLNNYLDKYKFTLLALHRARLLNFLVEKTGFQSIQFNSHIKNLKHHDSNVSVILENGEKITAKILIGADGIHSTIRNLVFGNTPIRYSGTSSFRGVINLSGITKGRHEAYEIWAPGHRLGYSLISEKEMYWYLTFDAKQSCFIPNDERYQMLLTFAEKYLTSEVELFQNMQPEQIIQTDISELKRIKQWNYNRICLLGDAAHAMTPNLGQGAAQAIEDALTLTLSLKKHGLNEHALSAYNATRIKKVRYIVTKSWEIGKMCHIQSKILQAIRDYLIRMTPHFIEESAMDRIYVLNSKL